MQPFSRRALLCAVASCAVLDARADRENWPVNSAWVKELQPKEQAAILFMLRGGFNKHVSEKIVPGAQTSAENLMFMLRMQASASYMLGEVATRNDDMRGFFVEYGERMKRTINAKDFGSYMADGEWANATMRRFADSIGMSYMARVAKQYERRLADTETALIAFAAIMAGR